MGSTGTTGTVGVKPAHQPIFSNKAKIGIGGGLIIAVGVIAVGILAKLDKLGLKLPNGFSQDAALGTSFAPLGIMLLGVGANKFLHWRKTRVKDTGEELPDVTNRRPDDQAVGQGQDNLIGTDQQTDGEVVKQDGQN